MVRQSGLGAVGLGRASISELRATFERHPLDVATLEVLNAELKRRSSDEALDLHGEVAMALVAARKVQPANHQHPAQSVLSSRGLSRPDERPLYRYRLATTEWERLRHHLHQLVRARSIDRADDRDAGAFALYAAEWFRREFNGGSYRWDDLLASIGGLSPETTAMLARRGLKWWGRRAHRTDHGEQRLMTLALEGGFPTRLLNSREQGWLAGTLRRLLARTLTLGEQPVEVVVELATADSAIPQTFRKPEFFTLLAELAIAVVALRSEAAPQAAAASVPTSAWLDAQREGWRDELPIALEDEGAARLIDELVSQSLERLGGASARCWRMLVLRDGIWSPALRLSVEGEIRVPTAVKSLKSRLRVHATGDLGDRLAGELALLDPPGEDGAWISRARPAAPRRPLRNYPFTSAAEVELRSDGRVVATLPWSSSGHPLHSETLAFIDDRENHDGSPNELVLLGTGSQRSRHEAIYVWAPSNYEGKAASGGALICEWEDAEHRLFRLTEPAFIGAPGEEFAFYYEPHAAAGRNESLQLDGVLAKGLSTPAEHQVFSGTPTIAIQSGVARQPLGFGRVFWRYEGEKSWTDLKRSKFGFGAIETVLRSTEVRAALDRVRFTVLPAELRLCSRPTVGGAADFWVEGVEGWSVEADGSQPYRAEAHGRVIRVAWSLDRRKLIELRLIAPDGRATTVSARFPLGDGAIVSSRGVVLADRSSLTLKQLRGARAFANGQAKLAVETTTRADRKVYQRVFEGETSLWSLRDQIAALMEASGDLDTEIRIAFEPNGPSVRIRRYEHDLIVSNGTVRLANPIENQGGQLSFEWRSLIDPTEGGRRPIAVLSTADSLSMRPFALPGDLEGPGIVYLCEGEAVVSRPRFAAGTPVDHLGLNALQKAVTEIGARYDPALSEVFDHIEQGAPNTAALLGWLHQLVEVSGRLPATAFGVLKHLSRRPRMLASLIASSPDQASLERVWALEAELPFLWILVEAEDWKHAFHAQYQRTSQALLDLGWEASKASTTAGAQVNASIDHLLLLDDDLEGAIAAAGLRACSREWRRSPRDIGQDRIRRLAGSDHENRPVSVFMADTQVREQLEKFPEWFQGFHEDHWEGLQAPLVAALRAAGVVKLLGPQRLRIREAIVEDPEHFSEAYATGLNQIARQRSTESLR